MLLDERLCQPAPGRARSRGSFLALLLALAGVSCARAEDHRPPRSAPAARAIASPSSAHAAAAAVARQLDADTAMKSASGASFEAPKGWFLANQGDLITLDGPERDLTLTLVEVPNQPDALQAIQAAWRRVRPNFARKPQRTTSPPPTDGWDAITQVNYESGGSEQHKVIALARRKGTTQYVALVDGSDAGLDRRSAQLNTVILSFKAVGVEEESLAGRHAHALDSERSQLLDRFIGDAMTRADVPGAAVAIVQGGKIVHERGFGLREQGKPEKVTPDTLFMLGSMTKSLTTLMMAKLVDEGKFTWDTPVTQVLPTFSLADAEVTKKMSMRHTVCACAGLPRKDMEFLFEYAKATPEQRVAAMSGMKPTTGFGETFQYSNSMVAAGGYVAAHALDGKKGLGPAYDEAMQTRVFAPLGMKNTTLSFALAKQREHATPHAMNIELTNQVLPLAYEEGAVAARPAGGAWSSVRDVANYMLLELAKGRDTKGRQLVSEANLLVRREPQIKITDKLAYGLGLFVGDDHGVALVYHGGNNVGFTADMYFLPEHDVGVVLLANAGDANTFRRVVRRRVLELLFDAKEEASQSLAFALNQRREVLKKELQKLSFEPEAAWSRSLVGSYESPDLGLITIRLEGSKRIFDVGEWQSAFARKTEDDGSQKLVLLDPPAAGLAFRIVEANGRKSLTLEASQTTYAFEMRSAPSAAASRLTLP